MKTILILTTFFALALSAYSRTITVAWDASATSGIVGYEIYVFDEASQLWVMVHEVADNPLTPELDTPLTASVEAFPDTAFRSHVRAVHSSGMRSLPSNEIILPLEVLPPNGYKIKVTVIVEIAP